MTNKLVTSKPFIQQSSLTERWYFVATWNEASNGMRVAETKIDVTDEIARIHADVRNELLAGIEPGVNMPSEAFRWLSARIESLNATA